MNKHEELDKSERGDGKTTNQEKVVKDKFSAIAFLEYADPIKYKTLWYMLRSN